MRRQLGILLVIPLLLGSIALEWLLFTGQPPMPDALGAAVLGQRFGVANTFSMPTYGPTPSVYARPTFQAGMAFPQWGFDAYGPTNRNYALGLHEIRNQTGARWVELPITLEQENYRSTTLTAGQVTPTPLSLLTGIEAAHHLGLHVFVTVMITLQQPTPWHTRWSGDIRCFTYATCAAWFASYWQVISPYLAAAQEASAEQFAIATELGWMGWADGSLWKTLLTRATSIYSGQLVVSVNFSDVEAHHTDLPQWMHDPRIAAIGVSSYFSLVDVPTAVPASQMGALFATRVQEPLDALARAFDKPVLISEIGYRNSTDALYDPYSPTTRAGPDPGQQAAIYRTAAEAAISDPLIAGIYFWAWSFPPFAPNNLPASAALRAVYTSPRA
jgi:hypothetical protein